MAAACPNPGMQWYALQVRQRYEKTVSTILREKGYTEFLPLYQSRRQWSDRIATVELPLFPGYVFCQFDACDRRVPVLTTPGVLHIVGFGRTAVPVEETELADIRRIIDSNLAAEPWPYLPAGSRVRIEAGSLSGVEGILVEAKSHHRLVLSITLLQRSVAVEIDSAWAVPLGSPLGTVSSVPSRL